MKDNAAAVIRLINELTSAELKRVLEHAKVRLAHGVAKSGKATPTESMVQTLLGIIVDECKRSGLDQISGMRVLTTTPNFKPFTRKVEEQGVEGFLRKQADLSKVQMIALARVSVRLLIQDLQEMHIAVSARTIMNHIHRIPGVLNKYFPGYAAAGLLHLIVRTEPDYELQKPVDVRDVKTRFDGIDLRPRLQVKRRRT